MIDQPDIKFYQKIENLTNQSFPKIFSLAYYTSQAF